MKRVLIGLFLLATAGLVFAQSNPAPKGTEAAPKVGDAAPDFQLPYATRDSIAGDSLRLSSLVGKRNVVLAFYPADWSGGCTREVCTFRDNFGMLGAVNADVIGISGDYVFSHYEWAKHHNLPFRLASDHDHSVAKRYGSYYEAYGLNRRTVFVVNKAGKVAYEDLAYSTRDSVSFGKLQAALKSVQ
jgi:peroxiredoxin Q/BCP